MEDKHDAMTYVKLADAANFYLSASFSYIDQALASHLCGILFQEKILKIPVNPKDDELMKNIDWTKLDTDAVTLLRQTEFENNLSAETHVKISRSWEESLAESAKSSRNFRKSETIDGIEILGHINNFAFFIETLVNRHLLFLRHTERLTPFVYNQIAQSKIMNQLIFILKEEVEKNALQFSDVNALFSLRNKTVHYTPDNAISLRINLAALIRIWQETTQLLKIFEARENFAESHFSDKIGNNIEYFNKKWVR